MPSLPLPSGCTESDFVGVFQVALVSYVNAEYITAEPFLRHLRAYLAENLITHNQRRLLIEVLERCGREWAETPQPEDGCAVPTA